MKKIINVILNCCIVFIFVIFVLILINIIKYLAQIAPQLSPEQKHLEYLISHPEITNEWTIEMAAERVQGLKSSIAAYSVYTVLGFISIASTIFIFICVNPKLFRISTYTNIADDWKRNKTEKAIIKAEKAEAAKQEKIKALEAELEELKKD